MVWLLAARSRPHDQSAGTSRFCRSENFSYKQRTAGCAGGPRSGPIRAAGAATASVSEATGGREVRAYWSGAEERSKPDGLPVEFTVLRLIANVSALPHVRGIAPALFSPGLMLVAFWLRQTAEIAL